MEQLFNYLRYIDLQKIKYDVSYTYDIIVEVSEVENAMKHLNVNKTYVIDGIHAEHLKHCNIVFTYYVCNWIFLPVVLVPIIKDKCGQINIKYNYRPTVLASIISKSLENILLYRMLGVLSTVCNQVSFKKKHGTDVYICLKGSY